MPADLITLEEFKIAMGNSTSEADDARDKKYSKAISAASDAIRQYTDRAFGAPVEPGTRVYEFDDSGYLDIDDCMKVNTVAIKVSTFEQPLETEYWRPEPQAGPPYTYLLIPKWHGIYSPEMGFKKNLDRISKERGFPGLLPTVIVNADWGWATVPEAVRQAAIWTTAKFQEKPDQLVSESIANYSYTTQIRGGGSGQPGGSTQPTALPIDAQEALEPYIRVLI